MSDPARKHPALTLRFSNESTHRALQLTAKALGVSMNELAERAIEHELARIDIDLEQKLTRTAELLLSSGDVGFEKAIAAFAQAEVTVDDPFRALQATLEDAYGIGELFACPL